MISSGSNNNNNNSGGVGIGCGAGTVMLKRKLECPDSEFDPTRNQAHYYLQNQQQQQQQRAINNHSLPEAMDCGKRCCLDSEDPQVLDLTVSTSSPQRKVVDLFRQNEQQQQQQEVTRNGASGKKSPTSTPSPSSSVAVATAAATASSSSSLASPLVSHYPVMCTGTTGLVETSNPQPSMINTQPPPPWYGPFNLRTTTPFGMVDMNPLLLQQHFNLFGTNPLMSGLPLPAGVVPTSLMTMLPLPPPPPLSVPMGTPTGGSVTTTSGGSIAGVTPSQGPLNLNLLTSTSQPLPWSHSSSGAECNLVGQQLSSCLLSQFSEAIGLCGGTLSYAPARSLAEGQMGPFDLFPLQSQSNPQVNGSSRNASPTTQVFNTSSMSDFSGGFAPLDFRLIANLDDSYDDPRDLSRPPSNPICKYGSYEECGLARCESAGLREHYHCNSCNKVIVRREEMIRHAKWHRKREESLQYGFMRYSPSDNCTVADCVHNGRQTHYHCLKPNCTKVYISTSDVQMHANFHRKDEVIIQEGFQRFRASEDCGIRNCPFYQEHTTHFHCRRTNCHFTFKNKADMEKHKLHHQKNDNFAKDGFRKFIKCETCGFQSCKYSGIINHIHCVRPGCDYVVHSSSQILSHKRKHDRRSIHTVSSMGDISFSDPSPLFGDSVYDLSSQFENESNSGAAAPPVTPMEVGPTSPENTHGELQSRSSNLAYPSSSEHDERLITDLKQETASSSGASLDGAERVQEKDLFCDLSRLVTRCIQRRQRPLPPATPCASESVSQVDSPMERFLFPGEQDQAQDLSDSTNVEHIFMVVRQHLRKPTDVNNTDETKQDAMCCVWPGCTTGSINSNQNNSMTSGSGEYCPHWVSHIWEAALLRLAFLPCSTPTDCAQSSAHLHCHAWPSCEFTVTNGHGVDFNALYTHVINHDSRVSSDNAEALEAPKEMPLTMTTKNRFSAYMHASSKLPRRRGRPPKYAKYVRVPRLNVPDEACKDNPHIREIKRSMFLPPEDQPGSTSSTTTIVCGVKLYRAEEPCPDNRCDYSMQQREHYHCVRPRCFMASDSLDLMNVHRREFHNHVTIAPGFEHFDRSVDCRRETCHNKKMTQHYHCTHTNCDYAFIRPTTMIQHARKHELSKLRANADKTAMGLLGCRIRPNLDLPYRSQHVPTSLYHPTSSISQSLAAHLSSFAPSHEYDLEPPCLPLGMSPLVAAHLPTFLSNAPPNGLPDPRGDSDQLTVANLSPDHERLPGFLPIWAAAMAAAVSAMTKMNQTGSPPGMALMGPLSNGTAMLPSVPAFATDLSRFSSGIDPTRPRLDSHRKEEEAPVGV